MNRVIDDHDDPRKYTSHRSDVRRRSEQDRLSLCRDPARVRCYLAIKRPLHLMWRQLWRTRPRVAKLMGHRHARGVLSKLRSSPGFNPEVAMADKSPRQHLSKKAGKSIKEKRADKQAKADATNRIEIVPPKKR